MADAKKVQDLRLLADRLRIHSIKSTNASKSGHPTSCSSMADVLSVLFFHEMRYSLENPRDPGSDRFILSKGHAAPILYAAWAEAGLFPTSELLKLRELDNDLEGHPTPRLNFVDVATGSLGQGLSVAAGMAYIGKNLDNAEYRTYCLLGDGESAEGSVWEALHFAGHYKLNNLCAIFDINRLGQSEATALQHDMDTYRKRLDAFGWNAIVIDGHDIEEIVKAFEEAHKNTEKPTAILARTFKGYKFPTISDSENWHGKPLGDKSDEVIKALLAGMDGNDDVTVTIAAPPGEAVKVDLSNITLASPPSYKLGELVATRLSYGTALAKLAKSHPRVIALDGDTKNSTYSDKIKTVDPNRYIECYIAEQNLVGVAMGAACRDRTVAFVSTFAAFFTRAFDQLRMGAISQTNINCVGSHAGVSIGEDGPSQMALEDLAMFRSIPTATVFYPSDAVSCERAVELAANKKGICFIRTSRPNTAVLYANDEAFQIGQGKVVLQHDNDVMVIVGAGVTLHEALAAAQTLENEHGILVAVVDPFTIKPIDEQLLIAQAKRVGGRVLTVEDHYPEGGLGEAVTSALSMEPNALVKRMAVREVPRSGPPQALLEKYNIDRNAIVKEVRGWLGN